MANSRAVDDDFVGLFSSLAELTLRYPPAQRSGLQATVTMGISDVPYFCDGVMWKPVGASYGIPVAGNKTLSASDLENIQDVSAVATLTIPSDAILGITDPTARVTVGAYQMTAGAVAWAAGAGVSPLRGTAPTAAQHLVTGLVHVGSNEWAYL